MGNDRTDKYPGSSGPGKKPRRLPGLGASGAPGLLLDQGRRIALAEGPALTLYRIDLREEDFEPEAEPVERHQFDHPVAALARGPAAMLIVMTVEAARTRLFVVDGVEIRSLAILDGRGADLVVVRMTAVVAITEPGKPGSRIEAVDLRSGQSRKLAEMPGDSPRLTLATRGDAVVVGDLQLRQQRRLPLDRDCGDDGGREPPRRTPGTPSGGSGQQKPPQCDCSQKPDDRPSDGRRDERPRPAGDPDGDPDCRPGGGWVPGDCHDWLATGHMLVRRPRCNPQELDCKTRLDYVPAGLRLVGRRLVATSVGNRRLTIIDPADLRILDDISFGRAGAAVFLGDDAPHLLAYRFGAERWQAVAIAGRPAAALDLTAGPPAESITFHGHNPDGIPPASDAPQTGTKRVLCVPVIEPGQGFADADVGNFGAYMRPHSFDIVHTYYDEASFDQLDLQIDLFGLDIGPVGQPLRMPRAFRSYFWLPFRPGGLTAAEPTAVTPYAFRLEGTESLTLRVDPRTGSTDDLDVPFAALALSESYNLFPVSLNFGGSESADLDVETGDGSAFTLNLQFTAETITIQSGDVDDRLADLASYLEGVIAAAASAAGVPGGSPLFEAVEVRRIRADGRDFGDLDISLRLRPAGSGKGRVTVTGQSGLNMIGMDNAVSGDFSLPGDASALESYLARAIRHGERAAGHDFTTRRIETVDVAFSGGTVTTTLEIEESIGGDGAAISVVSQSGLNALGFDNATSNPGASDPNDANALKESKEFVDDFFTALVERLGGSVPAGFFDPYVSILIGIVGAPPSGEWAADQPDVVDLRMFARKRTAKYGPDESIQLHTIYIGCIFDATPDNATLAHELGHALGLPDIYHQEGYRNDLRYLEDWAMMDNDGGMPHFCGYHKYALGWIPDTRIVPVPLPSPTGPTTREALLVPIEHWDPGMEAAVEAAFGNGVPVAQLLSIDLGGDGVQFDLVEARQRGVHFSHSLPSSPALIVTNAIDIKDDTRYAEVNLYRRKVHLLNTGHDLTSAGDTFDLATAPELAAVGVSVEILDIRPVVRPMSTVQVFHTSVRRDQADYVDLCFTETTPTYKSVDIWVDWAGDNASNDPADHRVYPDGEPIDQGETVHYPSSGTELHWVVGRVHNRGTAPAKSVKIRASKWDPPGAGDTGEKAEFASGTIEEVPAGGFVTIPLKWNVGPTEKEHQCLRLDIADWDLPEDPVTTIALASDDVWLSNNWAQQNVFDFVATSGSPYAPIHFSFSVTNEGVSPERTYLEPEGLAPGMKLTVTPRSTTIAPATTMVFRCVLELDETVIDAGCHNDRAFILWAWRETNEAFERWGGCKYTVRARQKTDVELAGSWGFDGAIPLNGAVVPDPGPGSVLVRSAFDNGDGRWQRVGLAAGGTFALVLGAGDHEFVELVAHFEGSADFAPAYSGVLKLARPHIAG